MTYSIIIEETISETFNVEARNAEEAMKIAERKYKKGEFVLYPGNLTFKQMAIEKPSNQATEWIEF